MKEKLTTEGIFKIIIWAVSITAITELGLSQFTIRLSRLSTAEQTGISLFAFLIFGLVTVFAVLRMKDGVFSKLFAVLMNFASALTAVWYIHLLLTDQIFLQGLFYVMDPRTRLMEPLTSLGRFIATLPIIAVALGALVYVASGLTILALTFATLGRNNGKSSEDDKDMEGDDA
ncbi:MAG: hypothetical protein FWB99_00520 [Treponema sp.]|nr:hypothetical protein [Treponema sp.]